VGLKAETANWYGVAAVMSCLYVYGAAVTGGDAAGGAFGISALHPFSPGTLSGVGALAAVAAVALGVTSSRVRLDHPIVALVAAAISLPLFFLLRTNFLNPDGAGFTSKFEIDVPRVGAHVTHDEMLELFVHSRFWYYTHRWWGWTVISSYQVLSCLAGALFVYVLVRLARRLSPSLPAVFMVGMLGGGYMQLFFGDVENYSITAALIALYVLAAWRFLAGEVSLWVPALAFAIAACFHLETGWLGPTLLYLFIVSHRRTGSVQAAWRSAVLVAALLFSTALYFQFHGLPLIRFFSSHAGHALQPNRGMFAIREPAAYWIDQLNLLLLLCPSLLMLLPLLAWRRIDLDERGWFLVVAAASTTMFQLAWKSQIGVYNDWNLYAINGFFLSLLIWRSASAAARTPGMRVAALLVAGVGWLHTYAWIVTNHSYGQ
jgi:hypothetical protein